MITATMAHLAATAMPPLTSVDTAEDLEALGKGTAPVNGAAFVLPFDDRGEANSRATGGFRQRVEVDLLVAVVIRKHDSAKGGKRVAAVDGLRDALEAALAGWSPDDRAHAPYELVAARAAPAGNGVTWYVQTWRTDRWIERT